MGTEFSIPTTGVHADFIAELLNALTLPQIKFYFKRQAPQDSFPQENFHENGKGDACLEIDLGPCRVQNFRGYIFAVERTRGGDLTH